MADTGHCPSQATSGDERLLRRSLGPTAWAVLADVAMDAQPDGDGVEVVATSARLVAAHLGIAKDTAARALRRLSAAGILCRRPQGTSAAGRFSAGTYELHLVCSVTPAPCPSSPDTAGSPRPERGDTASMAMPVSLPEATVSTRPRRRNRATVADGSAQLSLLDPAPGQIGVDEVGPWR